MILNSKNNLKIVLALLVFLKSLAVSAQDLVIDAERDNLWQDFSYDLGNMFSGVGYSYSRPIHWGSQEWGHFGIVTGGTLALFTIDDEFQEWTNGFSNDVPQWMIDYGNRYGNPENNYMLTGAVYLAGLFTKNQKLRRTGVLLISSATAGGFFQQVLTRVVGRARPKGGGNSDFYYPFNLDRAFNYDSFPSGHTMLAFTNAYAIAKQFKSPWVKASLYTVGSIPGFVRIIDDFHWLSDVAFSTIVSILIVESIDKFLDKKYSEKYNETGRKKFSWNLNFGPNRIGLNFKF